jgi:hypothetical protein
MFYLGLLMARREWIGSFASGLMRGKWDAYRGDQTYGQLTIANVIGDTKEVWKGAKKNRRAKRENKASAPEKTGLPQIQINNRQLRNTTTLAINALVAANFPPKLFMRIGQLCHLKSDEDGRPSIEILKDVEIKYYLTQAADFYEAGKNTDISVSPEGGAEHPGTSTFLPRSRNRGGSVLRPDGSSWQIRDDPATDITTLCRLA